MGEANRKIAEYENRIALLSQEIERLNMNLRTKVEENKQLENNNWNLTQELEGIRRKGGEYEIVVQEWQSKHTRLTQENEELRRRLN